jgi:hypothetical protein
MSLSTKEDIEQFVAHKTVSLGAADEFFGGQRVVEIPPCHLRPSASRKTFKIPLWKKEQEKTCFLPDIFKLARECECRLIILLDGDREWSVEGINESRKYLTLSDTTIDSSLESECSDKDGNCVLTWLRVYQPGERIPLLTSSSSVGGGADKQEGGNEKRQQQQQQQQQQEEEQDPVHDGRVFDSMTHEETAYGGFRCGILRVDAAAWAGGGAPPSRRVWSALKALLDR